MVYISRKQATVHAKISGEERVERQDKKMTSNTFEEKLIIRDARPEEIDEVARLLKISYEQYQPDMPPSRWQKYLKDILDIRSRLPESQLIVAELNGKLAGTVTLYPDARAAEIIWPEKWAGVRLLGVDPRFRGRGVGQQLMDECLRRARINGNTALGLHTTEMMETAKKMYERMGFVRVPGYDFHPAPDMAVMAYKLDL
jgi:GNAT superfamily N-acetyltransferase